MRRGIGWWCTGLNRWWRRGLMGRRRKIQSLVPAAPALWPSAEWKELNVRRGRGERSGAEDQEGEGAAKSDDGWATQPALGGKNQEVLAIYEVDPVMLCKPFSRKGYALRHWMLLPAALLFSGSALVAHADTFTLTGDATTISFSLPSTIVPYLHNDYADSFVIDDVPVTVNGVVHSGDYIIFQGSENYGGLWMQELGSEFDIFSQGGPQLFSGPVSQPTFLLGTFSLANRSVWAQYQQDFSLTIAPDTAPTTMTPEPGGLLLLGSGLMMGLAVLSRQWPARFTARNGHVTTSL